MWVWDRGVERTLLLRCGEGEVMESREERKR